MVVKVGLNFVLDQLPEVTDTINFNMRLASESQKGCTDLATGGLKGA